MYDKCPLLMLDTKVTWKVTVSLPYFWASFQSPYVSFSGIWKVLKFIESQYEMLNLIM